MADTITWASLDGVAFAICAEELYPKCHTEIISAFEANKDNYRRQARAALCAIQDPSEEMMQAGLPHGALRKAYEAIIQELLK